MVQLMNDYEVWQFVLAFLVLAGLVSVLTVWIRKSIRRHEPPGAGEKASSGGNRIGEQSVDGGTEPEATFDIDRDNSLQVYPTNEPYAYVAIESTTPPSYKVYEVPLQKGEEELLKEIKARLYEVIDADYGSLTRPEEFLRQKVAETLAYFSIKLDAQSMDKITYYVTRDFMGYGGLDPIMRDKKAEDISADGPGVPVYVYHQDYGSLKTNVVFDKDELDSLVHKLSQRGGKHISLAKPLMDASLPNQDRLQLTIGSEITTKGSTFTIRKFRETPFTPIDFVNLGTLSTEMAAYLWMAVENGFSILLAGGTASGKTSALNTISMFIPPRSKIVSIEDTREVNLMHDNWVPSVTREVDEGHSIDTFDLLRTALRQRPEYLLVGEVRGSEAYTLFQAMATGHVTFSTIHADSIEAVVKRLTKPPINVPLMLLDSLDIICLHGMVRIGTTRARRCTGIVEVTDVDFANDTLNTNEVFGWRPDEFTFSGESKVFAKMMEKLNISEEDMSEEFSRRVRILNKLRERGIKDFPALSMLFFKYSINPEEAEKGLTHDKQSSSEAIC